MSCLLHLSGERIKSRAGSGPRQLLDTDAVAQQTGVMTRKPTVRDLRSQWTERVAATSDPLSEHSRARARELRHDMSLPEVKLWQRLRARKLDDLKFRRQHTIGPYTVDFYCHEVRLVVEVDGHAAHRERGEQDAARDRWMESQGVSVLRLSATVVLENMPRALGVISEKAKEIRARVSARTTASSCMRAQENEVK